MFKAITTVSLFSRHLLLVLIASYIAIKHEQTRIIKNLKFKTEVRIDCMYKK